MINMKKTENDIREQFRITDRIVVIDEKRKKETLSLLQKEILQKKTGVIHNRKEILIQQFRYMDKSVLGIHAAFGMISLLIMALIPEHEGYEKLMMGIKAENIIFISTVISCILGVVSILGISRVFFSGIAELSESCYFNVRQMVAFQIFLSGIIDLTVLFFDVLFVGVRWKINLLQIGLYIFVPFLITECCCMMTVLSEVGRRNSYLLVMVGAFTIVFNCILASSLNLYRMTALAVWGIAFVIGLLLFTVQIKILFRGIEKGEILCTN